MYHALRCPGTILACSKNKLLLLSLVVMITSFYYIDHPQTCEPSAWYLCCFLNPTITFFSYSYNYSKTVAQDIYNQIHRIPVIYLVVTPVQDFRNNILLGICIIRIIFPCGHRLLLLPVSASVELTELFLCQLPGLLRHCAECSDHQMGPRFSATGYFSREG